MRLTLLQLRVDDAEPAPERLERVTALIRAQDATASDLIVLPELWPTGAFTSRAFRAAAQPLDGPVVTAVRAAVRDLGVPAVAGSFMELAPGADGDRLYNTTVLIGPDGEIAHTYRKVHLFGFDSGEAAVLSSGGTVEACPPPFEALGLSTCYDLRFPETYRLLLDAGAQIAVIPTGWPASRLDHWLTLTRARAIENQMYVVGCNQVGTQEGTAMGGHSVVIDPWGRVLAEGGDGEELLTVDIDLAQVAKVRANFPVLRDRRLGLPTPPSPPDPAAPPAR